MSEPVFTCFGYGSLVNAATLTPGLPAARVRLRGWRRGWRHSGDTAFGRRCTLTVFADADCAIDGVVIALPQTELPALDRREAQYDRVPLEAASLDWLDGRPDGWPLPCLYVGRAEYRRPGDRDFPVLLSYVDVVLSGFMRVFGAAGAERFLASTSDWHVPVLDDRAEPRYPRAQALDADERRFVDRALAALGCPVFAP